MSHLLAWDSKYKKKTQWPETNIYITTVAVNMFVTT